MSRPFHFKQFSVIQEHSSFKVGTDSVILGAWVHPNKNANLQTALDIGTGTGLLALMLAQKKYAVTAVEPNESSAQEAQLNFKNANFSNQLSLENCSIQEFVQQTNQQFEVVVCNPPYFQNSLQNPNQQIANARHNNTLQFNELANCVNKLLLADGWFYTVLPVLEFEQLKGELLALHIYETKRLTVFPTPKHAAKRICGAFRRIESSVGSAQLFIENGERHNYHESYKALTKDFYLNF